MHDPTAEIRVGAGAFTYQVESGWGALPAGWSFVEVAGVATDAEDRVFVFNRGEHPVVVFDREGRFLAAWGEGMFRRPHGIAVGPDGAVYCTDDVGQVVRKLTPEGDLLATFGTPDAPSDTGCAGNDFQTIIRSGGPFNYPTNVAFAPSGEIYVADGYGNARVHRFTAEGRLVGSWGEPGSGPGEFRIPHGIAVDSRGTVYVADRENSRLQLFSPEGELLGEWSDIARPCQVFIGEGDTVYVAELGYRAGMWPGTEPPSADATGGRVSVFDPAGTFLARWGGGDRPMAPGDFCAPHDLCVDRRGDLYVGEVTVSAGVSRGLVTPDCHCLQKFVRMMG
jgi:DNA-binding beta-propeller fold protein YncE